MKTFITAIAALIIASTGIAQDKVPGTANVKDKVVVFIETMPSTQYRHLGRITCTAFAPDNFDGMITHMIGRARKEYPQFDALIFRTGKGLCEADVIEYYRDPKAKKSRAKKGEEESVNEAYLLSETSPKNNIYLFIENNPTTEFTMLGKVELPTNFRSTNVEDLITEMRRVAAEAYPDHNGIVFISGTAMRKATVIKLK